MPNKTDNTELTPHERAEQSLSEIGGGSQYSNDQRREAVTLYVVKGNQQAVSDATGIPQQTISQWLKSAWWDDVASEVRCEINDDIRADMLAVVRAGTARTLEAMPSANASQAMTASAIAFDKIRLLDNQPTSIGTKVDSGGILSKLEELSDRLDQREVSVISDQ